MTRTLCHFKKKKKKKEMFKSLADPRCCGAAQTDMFFMHACRLASRQRGLELLVNRKTVEKHKQCQNNTYTG